MLDLDTLTFDHIRSEKAVALDKRAQKLPKWAQAYINDLKTLKIQEVVAQLEPYIRPQPETVETDNRVWCTEGSVIGPNWRKR